jgi:vanillate/3-O-methylgallate O-demethylase
MRLLSDTSINSLAKFDLKQAKHIVHCDDDGKIIAEGIATRLAEDEFVLFGRGTFWVDYVRRQGDYDVTSTSVDSFNFQVAGPNALAVVEKAAGMRLREVKFMHSADVVIAGHRIMALRQGMSGEPGFELQGRAEHARDVCEAIVEAGQEFGLRKLGGRAVFVNHLEACFPTIIVDYMPAIFGAQMDDFRAEFLGSMPAASATFYLAGSFEAEDISAWYRSPVELGWGKSIKFDHDFKGRDALEAELAAPRRQIRTLVWNPDDVVQVYASLFRKDALPFHFMEMPRDQRGFMYADKVMAGDRSVGVATSRGYSYYFREMISLAVIDVDQAEIGNELSVVWGNPGERQITIRATVAPAPYKQDNRRVDLNSLR